MVVEVLVAPEVALDQFAGPQAVAAGRALSVAVPAWPDAVAWRKAGVEGGFAVAECRAQVVAVGVREGPVADEAGDRFGG